VTQPIPHRHGGSSSDTRLLRVVEKETKGEDLAILPEWRKLEGWRDIVAELSDRVAELETAGVEGPAGPPGT
jgi:hypothetical protein